MVYNKDFSEISAQEAHSLIRTEEWFISNDAFYSGDHWQRGNGLADTLPPSKHYTYDGVKRGIERIFTSENLIQQCTDRRVDGVTSLAPTMAVTSAKLREAALENTQLRSMDGVPENMPDTEGEQRRTLKINAAIKAWFNNRKGQQVLAKAIEQGCLHDRSYLRIMVPHGLTDNGRLPKVKSPEDALEYIYIESLRADQAVVIEDPKTKAKCGIYAFADETNTEPTDPKRGKQQKIEKQAEVVYYDSISGETHLSIRSGSSGKDSVSMDLNGCLTIHELSGLLLISDTVRSQQKAVNTTRTHMVFHNKATDFQRRIFLNAQPLGTEVIDPETGETIIVNEENTETPGVEDLFLEGVEEETADGVRIKDPKVIIHDPQSVQRFLDSEGQSRRGILRDCHQLHIEISDDATSTGQARIQAMADHQKDLGRVKRELDHAGMWMMKAVWALAEYLSGADVSKDLIFKFSSVITIGQIDTDSRRALVEETNAGLVSRATAMSERGIEDTTSEMQLVETDPMHKLRIAERMVGVIKSLTDAGSSLEGAAAFVGLTQAQIDALTAIQEAEPADDDPAQGDSLPDDVQVDVNES